MTNSSIFQKNIGVLGSNDGEPTVSQNTVAILASQIVPSEIDVSQNNIGILTTTGSNAIPDISQLTIAVLASSLGGRRKRFIQYQPW